MLLNAEQPEFAEALDVRRQARSIARPFLVLGQLDISHGVSEALSFGRRLLDGVR